MSENEIINITILSTVHNILDARVQRLAKELKTHKNIKINFIGTGKEKDNCIFDNIKLYSKSNLIIRMLRNFFIPFIFKIDIVIVLSIDSFFIVYYLLNIYKFLIKVFIPYSNINIYYVADIYEDYFQLFKDRKQHKLLSFKRIVNLFLKLNYTAIKKYNIIAVADEHVPPFNCNNRMIVKNIPNIEDINIINNKIDKRQLRAIYIGDVRVSRGLLLMRDVFKEMPNWRLDIIGNVAEHNKHIIDTLSDNVTYHGRLSLTDSWKFANGALVGLSLLQKTPAYIDAIPTKIYEYALHNIPVISTSLPRVLEIINKYNIGWIKDTKDDICQLLYNISNDMSLLDDYYNNINIYKKHLMSQEYPTRKMVNKILSEYKKNK